MNLDIKNLRDSSYEMISFIFNKIPCKNKILAKIEETKYKNFDLILEKYYYIQTEYLIISANPIFSIIVSNYLKENKIKNVFINNVYEQDNFNYSNVNKEQIKAIFNNLNITTDDFSISNLMEQANNSQYIYTSSKKIALSSLGKKYKDYNCFSFIQHDYDKIEKIFSDEYKNIWSSYIKSINRSGNFWNNENANQKENFYYIFAKKIILLMDKNKYIHPNIINNEQDTFVFDYKKHHGENFKNDFLKFIKK